MAYGRYRGRRRRGGRRRYRSGWGNKVGDGLSLAKKALKMAMFVKGLVNVEKKFFDTAFSDPVSTTGSVTSICDIPSQEGAVDQGQSRDGDQVRVKALQFNGTLTLHASATNTVARLSIVMDKMALATPPAIGDIYESASTVALHNMANRNRFVVIWSRQLTISPDKPAVFFKCYKRMSTKLQYAGDTTDQPQNICFYVVMSSNEATNTPSVTAQARLRFIDN